MIISAHGKRVQAARTALVLDNPFFGLLALQLAIVEDQSCDTAWTDGRSIGYSPAFVDTLTADQLVGLIAHEVMHCALGHPWRRSARNHKQWNVACDYALNAILLSADFVLPAGALFDTQYAGKSAEWIYDRLPVSQDDDPTGSGTGTPDPAGTPTAAPQAGEVRDAPQEADAPTEAEWAETAAQASKVAEAYGTSSGGLQRDIQRARRTGTDWSMLHKYIQDACANDYTWVRPNVRYVAHGLYLPSLSGAQCGRIVAAVDTSGSVDTVLLSQFSARLQTLMDELHPSRLDVICCDSHVQCVETFERGDTVTIHPQGGGGTAFQPVFDHVAADDDPPVVLVYLTDLEGSMPTARPDYPVLWAVWGGNTDVPPFGDVLPLD